MFKIILLKIKICSPITIIMSANFNENKFSWNWTRISFRVLISTQTAITLSSIVYKMAKRFASHTPSEIIEKNLNVVQTILWKGINKSQSSEGRREKNQHFDFTTLTPIDETKYYVTSTRTWNWQRTVQILIPRNTL